MAFWKHRGGGLLIWQPGNCNRERCDRARINFSSLCPSVRALVGTWALQGNGAAFLFTKELIKRRRKAHSSPLSRCFTGTACLRWSYFKRGEAVKLDHVEMILKKTYTNQLDYRFLLRQQENVICWRAVCRNRRFKMLV